MSPLIMSKYMRKNWISLLLVASLPLAACAQEVSSTGGEQSYDQPVPLVITENQKRAFQLGTNLLSNHHYRPLPLREISTSVMKDYLNQLDYAHLYFLQSDIDSFRPDRSNLYFSAYNGDLSAPIAIYQRYRQRASDLNAWTLARLEQPMDLEGSEMIEVPDYMDKHLQLPWPKSLEEVHQYQEKRLKDSLIRLMMTGRDKEEALDMLKKRYQGAQRRLNQITSDDVFEIYMNAIAGNFDPHTNYLSPRNSEDFDIHMRLSLEGIGATLSYEDEKIEIQELVPGGPAYESGKLHIKDRIIAVGQGEDGEMQDVVGMRLDKAVRLIRGKKGTIVRLLIEPANAARGMEEVSIVRDKVKLEEQAAQAYVETVTEKGVTRKLGVIRLPSFYLDFQGAQSGKEDYRSTSRDVARLLNELKAQQVEGVVLDLRGDGGGSLFEAVQTVGLFIDQGPVVMVSDAEGETRLNEDEEAGALYDGPLAVMIDHYSASASEIFAAAIQDYGRGLVIGDNSYGKGSVQTMVELNRFMPRNSPSLGEVKFTIAMFHRITGGSTQLQGVKPDIKLPSALSIDKIGERSEPHALPWKSLPPADYVPYDDVSQTMISQLQVQHQQRMSSDPVLSRFSAYIEDLRKEAERREWSLNLQTRLRQYENWKNKSDEYDRLQQESLPLLASDAKRKSEIEERNAVTENEGDKESFTPDVALYEALNVLSDFIQLHQKTATDNAA